MLLDVRSKVYRQNKLMENAFSLWSEFLVRRRTEKRLEKIAQSFRHKSILTRHIAKWIISGDRKRTYKGNLEKFLSPKNFPT